MEKKQRIYFLDNVCGILILQVILGHQVSFCRYSTICFDYIYITLSFFMFWFFFKGGMMFKDRNVMDTVKSSAKRLLLPYFVFMIFGLVCEAYLESLHDVPLSFPVFLKSRFWQIINHSFLVSVAPCWFLLSLFVVRVVFQLCFKYRIAPIITAIASFIAAYLVYYFSILHDYSYLLQWGDGHCWNLHLPYYLGNMSLGLMCYSIGYVLRDKQYSKWIVIGATFLFVVKYFMWADFDFVKDNSIGSNYPLAVLYGLSGCIVFNNIFKQIANVKIPVLTYIGEYSMIFYLVHWPVMYFIIHRFYGTVFDLSPEVRFVALSGMLTIVLWISGIIFRNKRLRFLFGM